MNMHPSARDFIDRENSLGPPPPTTSRTRRSTWPSIGLTKHGGWQGQCCGDPVL
jgi:hypothetical protein